MSGFFVYETGRQLDGSYIGDGKDLYICNMDYEHPNMDNGLSAPGTLGLFVEGADITNAADVRGETKACVLDGTARLLSKELPLIGSKDYSFAISVYFADWSTVASDSTIISQMDSAGDNGWKLYLKSDETLHLLHRSGGATTLDLSASVSTLTSGWHNIAVMCSRGVSQIIYVDGAAFAASTDATDAIGIAPTATALTITGISKEKLAEITCSGAHGLTDGDLVTITGVVGNNGSTSTLYDLHGMDTLNGNKYPITSTGVTTFTIPINSTNFDTYSSGGTATFNPPIYTEIGSWGQGQERLTGRVDEIVIQIDGYWSTDVAKLLDAVLNGYEVILDQGGSVRVITVS